MFDWTDARFYLAVARAGSAQAAARALGVDATTVARRVAAFEREVGIPLFERRQTGYRLSPQGEALLPAAEQMDAAATALAAAAAATVRDLTGTVRVSAEDSFTATILPPMIAELHALRPGLRIELDTSDEPRDLDSGIVDIALRTHAAAPTGTALVGRRVGWDHWAVYCGRAYAAAHGAPGNRRELRGHPIIAGGPPRIWESYRAWLAANGLEEQVAMHADTIGGLLGAARAGSGLAALPCLLAEFDETLVRCLPPGRDPRQLWLLTTQRLRRTPRVRAVMDFLGDRLVRRATELQDRLQRGPESRL